MVVMVTIRGCVLMAARELPRVQRKAFLQKGGLAQRAATLLLATQVVQLQVGWARQNILAVRAVIPQIIHGRAAVAGALEDHSAMVERGVLKRVVPEIQRVLLVEVVMVAVRQAATSAAQV
jgi:hypothetical protein